MNNIVVLVVDRERQWENKEDLKRFKSSNNFSADFNATNGWPNRIVCCSNFMTNTILISKNPQTPTT